MSSPLDYDSVKSKYYFTPLIDSNSFGTVDYDADINAEVDYSVNHLFKSMTIQELTTLHHKCETERTKLRPILAMSVQNPQLIGYVLRGNRPNFLYVAGSSA